MSQPSPETKPASGMRANAVLELIARNHPGVMSHVCGLFARRAYNVEGIFCVPIGDGARSRILLMVNEDGGLDQMMKQVAKLEDVLETKRHDDTHTLFRRWEHAVGEYALRASASE